MDSKIGESIHDFCELNKQNNENLIDFERVMNPNLNNNFASHFNKGNTMMNKNSSFMKSNSLANSYMQNNNAFNPMKKNSNLHISENEINEKKF